MNVLASIAELTISDSVVKVCVFQPDGNKSVENFAWNKRSVIRLNQVEVKNDKTSYIRVLTSYSNTAQSEQSTEQPATWKHCEEGD